MTGEKKQLFVIGKSKSPRCFQQVRCLSVKYDFSSNAWMQVAFTGWLKERDRSLRRQKRKILLLVDNCSAYPRDIELTNIKASFFAPSTTSILQPCDQGIIKAYKSIFHRDMCRLVLQKMGAAEESATATQLAQNISLLDAINLLSGGWQEFQTSTIKNCWKHSALAVEEEDQVKEALFMKELPLEQDKFVECANLVDDDIDVFQPLADVEIMQEVMSLQEDKDDDDDAEEVDGLDKPLPSCSKIREALIVLQRGLQAKEDYDFTQFMKFERCAERFLTNSLKQETIDKFLGK